MVRQGPQLPLQRLPPLLLLQLLLRTAPGPRLRPSPPPRRPEAVGLLLPPAAASCLRSRSMQALDARRYSQVEKLLPPGRRPVPCPGVEERLLGRVLGVLPVPGHSKAQGVDPVLVGPSPAPQRRPGRPPSPGARSLVRSNRSLPPVQLTRRGPARFTALLRLPSVRPPDPA